MAFQGWQRIFLVEHFVGAPGFVVAAQVFKTPADRPLRSYGEVVLTAGTDNKACESVVVVVVVVVVWLQPAGLKC